LEKLTGLVADGFDAKAVGATLASERARVFEGLDERVAKALADHLGKKETHAEAVQGAAPKHGLKRAFRGGLPLLAVGGGAVLGLFVHPIGIAWGLLAGLGGGVGAGAWNANRRMPVVAHSQIQNPVPWQLAQANESLAALYGKIPDEAMTRLRGIVEIGFRVAGRVLDQDDVLSVGGDLEMGMGQQAVGLLTEAIRHGELIARDGLAGAGGERLSALAALEEQARALMGEIDKLDNKFAGQPG